METFRISRSPQDPLEFEGILLAKATSPQHPGADGQRGYELSLYRQAKNGFVLTISFWTNCPNERSVVQAEVVDEPKDVENVLLVFEPCEHLNQKAVRALPDEQRQRLQKCLCRLYDEQVTQILDVLSQHLSESQELSEENADASLPGQKRGLLNFLGLK